MAVNIQRATYKTKYFAALAASMRNDDRQEALAMLGMSGAPALYLSMYCSQEMYIAEMDDVPLCAWGVCRTNGINLIWFIASQEIEQHKRELLTLTRPRFEALLQKYGRLENFVDARSKKSLRFIRWLGFTINLEPVAAGVRGEALYHFYKERGEAACAQ
ncbi:MAG: hypothetical protein VB133_07500 [Anaeromusa sp.]|uniref:hypothetical protein n=1 Tax=Anaeromusa sp. TaxID=1872520 RepID=UPI002B1ECD33|nr:hypothetical protein [Anaeromusa sp.]MEA4834961.1 hypothetical protein [Anaeromusa sp.]